MTNAEFTELMARPENVDHRKSVCNVNNLGAYIGYVWDIGFTVTIAGQLGCAVQTYTDTWGKLERVTLWRK